MSLGVILCVLTLMVTCTQAVDYKEGYVNSRIDHFNFQAFGGRTYKQRYIYNDTWWDRGRGPIFFYAGNEYPIELFWDNSGFITDIAPSYKALVLFGEHRYYGKSLPFGNDGFTSPLISWLNAVQAIADFAFLIKAVKKEFKAENCPVIAFGGSYGGSLATYMRFKYPNVIQGSIVASSPIFLSAGLVSADTFYQHATKVFSETTPTCEPQVRAAFRQLDEWAQTGQSGLDQISQTFRLCKPLKSHDEYVNLLEWIRESFTTTAFVNYPYPTDFLGKFPAFPVKVMCDRLGEEDSPAAGLRSACGVYRNNSGDVKCYDDIGSESCNDASSCKDPRSRAWDYQGCTEINIEASTDGVNDMFPVLPYTAAMRDEYCLKAWNVRPRRDWLEVVMWGKNISSASNIVFSNGDLDPWMPGGVLTNVTDSVVAYVIKGGAHHLDLRSSNPADPESVKEARNFEKRNIDKWIKEYHDEKNR